MPRPPLAEHVDRVNVTLPAELRDQLDAFAHERDASRSEAVRILLRYGLSTAQLEDSPTAGRTEDDL